MPFLVTADQLELQRGIRDLLTDAWPISGLVDAVAETAPAEAVWNALTQSGLFALRAELEASWADISGVFEELGRALAPGPLVATFLAATVTGDDSPTTAISSARDPLFVTDLDFARRLLVVAGVRATIAGVDDVRATPVEDPVDPMTTVHQLHSLPNGSRLEVDGRDLMRQGMLLTGCLQVGIAARLTDLAVDYAKTREQFGRPIGGFQAIKHLCADAFARTELARVATQAAAVTLDDPGVGDVDKAIAGAKLLADEAATVNARTCVQVHGGMGFTWEVPVHLFLKRSWRHATEWATVDQAAELVAQAL